MAKEVRGERRTTREAMGRDRRKKIIRFTLEIRANSHEI
jgi:hypothetical protein